MKEEFYLICLQKERETCLDSYWKESSFCSSFLEENQNDKKQEQKIMQLIRNLRKNTENWKLGQKT